MNKSALAGVIKLYHGVLLGMSLGFVIPIIIAVLAVVLSAIGMDAFSGSQASSLHAITPLMQSSQFWLSSWLTLKTGLLSSVIALSLCGIFLLKTLPTLRFWPVNLLAGVLFIMPHAMFGILVQTLLSPSGLLAKLIITVFGISINLPSNDLLIVNDASGLTYSIALGIKEFPFLWMIIVSYLYTHSFEHQLKSGMSLGYLDTTIIMHMVWPQIYPILRLPFICVLIYCMSHVEMAQLLGPSSPQTMALWMLEAFNDPTGIKRQQAFFMAIWLLILILVAIVILKVIERVCASFVRVQISTGQRTGRYGFIQSLSPFLYFGLLGLFLIGMIEMILLSFAEYWVFPDILPQALTTKHWQTMLTVSTQPMLTSLGIGFVSASFSVLFVILVLAGLYDIKASKRYALIQKQAPNWVTAMLTLPLVLPVIGLMFGLIWFLRAIGLGLNLFMVIAVHCLYIIPYAYFTLVRSYQRFDNRFIQVASSLGLPPLKSYFTIKLRMLAPMVILSFLLSLIISFSQYLTTLLIGAGHIETLTTEAVILSEGGSKRMLAVTVLFQFCLSAVILLVGALIFYGNHKKADKPVQES